MGLAQPASPYLLTQAKLLAFHLPLQGDEAAAIHKVLPKLQGPRLGRLAGLPKPSKSWHSHSHGIQVTLDQNIFS